MFTFTSITGAGTESHFGSRVRICAGGKHSQAKQKSMYTRLVGSSS